MATKKCPKCGEENPAEAVMCWACYTPLAGGAAAATGGGLVAPRGGAAAVAPGAAAAAQEEKQPIDPKIFLVVGLLFGAIVIGGFTTGIFGGGGGGDESLPAADPTTNKATTGTNKSPAPAPAPAPGPPIAITPGNPSALPPIKHYDVVSPPNPRYETGTIGILATQPNISAAQAGELAKYAKNQFAPNGRWRRMQVLVFNNPDVAKQFSKYQAKRDNIVLSETQYNEMAQSGWWASVPAFLEAQGSTNQVFSPSRSPGNWWTKTQ